MVPNAQTQVYRRRREDEDTALAMFCSLLSIFEPLCRRFYRDDIGGDMGRVALSSSIYSKKICVLYRRRIAGRDVRGFV